jgi:uncharacterized protein YcbK (DUF882 family)
VTDWDLRISQHFTLGEFVPTDRAAFLRLDAWGRTKAITNFGKVAHQLEALRRDFGEPIHITSGWRSKEHNRSIGGAPNSDHINALAADFQIDGFDPRAIYQHCLLMHEQGHFFFDQLIGYTHHIHIGMGDRMRGMAWTTKQP